MAQGLKQSGAPSEKKSGLQEKLLALVKALLGHLELSDTGGLRDDAKGKEAFGRALSPLKEGYLEKLSSGMVKQWHSRYFEQVSEARPSRS